MSGASNPGQGVMNDQLSAIEWSVVALARGDRLSSLQAPGKFRAFLRRFLEGDRPSPAFADKRLEALRRVSVHAWHRGFAIPEAELDRFLNAGFSEQQFEAVISRIQRSKAQASCCKNGPQPGHVHALA
jgi:hypothetical protein